MAWNNYSNVKGFLFKLNNLNTITYYVFDFRVLIINVWYVCCLKLGQSRNKWKWLFSRMKEKKLKEMLYASRVLARNERTLRKTSNGNDNKAKATTRNQSSPYGSVWFIHACFSFCVILYNFLIHFLDSLNVEKTNGEIDGLSQTDRKPIHARI